MSEGWRAVGSILQWPRGYAMTIGRAERGTHTAVVRCCDGHRTPEEAKTHGLGRLIETATARADRDIAQWTTTEGGQAQ